MQKVIILSSQNCPPEYQIEDCLQELGAGWRITSAQTSLAVAGKLPYVVSYYVTTIIVEKEA